MNLKHLPAAERPRERLARYGSEALSTVELIAILLGSGTKAYPVLHLASQLLSRFGSLQALADASLPELKQVKGIGAAKAVQLKAALSLRLRLEEKEEGALLDAPEKVYRLIRAELSEQKTEVLMVILRDVKRRCLHREIIARGTLTELLLHPREVFHEAIRHRAHSLIVAHNHPSGDATPSARDIEMTSLLAAAGQIVGIELSDHLVIGRSGYVSLREKGLLRKSAQSVY